jgi:hypothetical protein
MLIPTVVHICLAAQERTPRSRAQAIKGRSMVSWVTSCVCTTLARSLKVVAPALLPLAGSTTLLLPSRCMEPLRGAVWSDFRVSFSVIFFQNFITDTPDFANA